jgi:DNA repair protein RadC
MLSDLSLLDRPQLEAIVLDAPVALPSPEINEPLRCSDVAIAEYLPAPAGARTQRLRHVLAAAHELLTRIATDAMRGRSLIERPQALKEYLQIFFAGTERESFVVVFLDAHHRVIACEEMFAGTLTQTSVYPREVVRRALQLNAASVAFGHCHPSGHPEPSRADEHLTHSLKSALATVEVRVIDHIVVGAGATVSFAERGLL